ncbi:MAG: pilus assembly protein TadG-related protein [Pelagimonas sp.]|nr:pilus assembly protein TadG-related protein [Pelagimonas sp.]
MSYLAISGALIMMIFGGIGIDLMHTELKRTKIQNTLDRAVLAAANMQNTRDANDTVQDYFRAMNLTDTLGAVDVDQGLNFKEVGATAGTTTSTLFTHLIGQDTMYSGGSARAEERQNKVEISLVLDISGSMGRGNKMANLQVAAKEFVDTLLTDANRDLISINLIPYSEQVNAGPDITANLNVDWDHNYSHCLEFPDSHYNQAALNTGHQFDQMQHFQWNYSGRNDLNDTICPRHSYERITAFSQDADALKSQIDQLQPRAGTQIFVGMKWATALLDPSTRDVASGMISSGDVDATFAGRPAAHTDHETMKTVVLMTDGQNSTTKRIRSWAYNSPSEISHWAHYNLNYYLYRYVNRRNRSSYYYTKYQAYQGDAMLSSICTAAKSQGIIVWGIGFETTDHGANVMRNCASSPSHFFRVEGIAIQDAFSSIARTISQLRLTQ